MRNILFTILGIVFASGSAFAQLSNISSLKKIHDLGTLQYEDFSGSFELGLNDGIIFTTEEYFDVQMNIWGYDDRDSPAWLYIIPIDSEGFFDLNDAQEYVIDPYYSQRLTIENLQTSSYLIIPNLEGSGLSFLQLDLHMETKCKDISSLKELHDLGTLQYKDFSDSFSLGVNDGIIFTTEESFDVEMIVNMRSWRTYSNIDRNYTWLYVIPIDGDYFYLANAQEYVHTVDEESGYTKLIIKNLRKSRYILIPNVGGDDLSSLQLCLDMKTQYDGSGQFIAFAYDNSGNRISRTLRVASRTLMADEQPQEILTEKIAKRDVKIYSSVEGQITVEFSSLEGMKDGTMHVYSFPNGLPVLTRKVKNLREDLDISSKASGIYILLIDIDGEKTSYKLMK